MKARIALSVAVAAVALAGCSNSGTLTPVSTASVGGSATAPAVKTDPACVTLASQIDGLRTDGIAEKVEKAAAKKYKMKPADLTQADQLNKANAEFQLKCAPNIPRPATAQATPANAQPIVPGSSAASKTATKPSTSETGPPVAAKPKTVKPVAAVDGTPKKSSSLEPAKAKSAEVKPARVAVPPATDAAPASEPQKKTASADEGPELPPGISIAGQ